MKDDFVGCFFIYWTYFLFQLIGIRDVSRQEILFAKLVEASPETIACPTQNIPISKVLKMNDAYELPSETVVMKKKLKNGYES